MLIKRKYVLSLGHFFDEEASLKFLCSLKNFASSRSDHNTCSMDLCHQVFYVISNPTSRAGVESHFFRLFSGLGILDSRPPLPLLTAAASLRSTTKLVDIWRPYPELTIFGLGPMAGREGRPPGGEEDSRCIAGRATGVDRPEAGREGGREGGESRRTGIRLRLTSLREEKKIS